MKFLKQFAFFGISAIFLMSLYVSVPAQKQSTTQISTTRVRTVVGRRRHYNPFWRDEYLYDPYFYDPFLRAQREKYYLQKDVKDKRNDLAKHREKYNSDGFLTIEESEKLARDEEKLAKAIAKLNKFDEEN